MEMNYIKSIQIEPAKKVKPDKPKVIGMRKRVCSNRKVHNIYTIKYDDESIWVSCPDFGWYIDGGKLPKLGCTSRKKRCTWYLSTH